MIDYLKKYDLSDDDIKIIKENITLVQIQELELLEDNVCNILDYLKTLGVDYFYNLIMYRSDLCFMEIDEFKDLINKYDPSLIKYIIENDIGDLINFNI